MTPASLGHKPIPGIKHLLTMDRKRARHRHLTVSRAYGGCLTHDLVRERYCIAAQPRHVALIFPPLTYFPNSVFFLFLGLSVLS